MGNTTSSSTNDEEIHYTFGIEDYDYDGIGRVMRNLAKMIHLKVGNCRRNGGTSSVE